MPILSQATRRPSLSDSLKRGLQVYVEIPPSPLHNSRMAPLKRKSSALDGHRTPGTPLSSKTLNHATQHDSMEVPLKKPKLSDKTGRSTKAPAPQKSKSEPVVQFPNGFFYCHQCGRKRDCIDGIQCTFKPKNRCKTWYCKACVRNRYGLEIKSLKTVQATGKSSSTLQHVDDTGYLWKCPKCCDNCNCHKCRKAKGLPPTGQMKTSELLDPQMLAAATSGSKPIPEVVIDLDLNMKRLQASLAGTNGGNVVKQQIARKRRKAIPPLWTKIPTDLNRAEAEDRFYIREFALRFASIMNISQTHLEDLDEFDNLSDACAKALIMNLIDLVAADLTGLHQKELKSVVRRLSSAGNLPSALWNILVELRDTMPSHILNFPDPSPLKNCDQVRTRNSNFVQRAFQLIPVIIGIAECALQGASVRLELDNGAKDFKDIRQSYWDSSREEKDRWAAQKQAMLDTRTESESKEGRNVSEWSKSYHTALKAHRSKIASLDLEYNLKIQEFSPRFQPLGMDLQGRIYYVSSVYKGKKASIISDRNSLKKWSWFLAVWGRVTPEEGAPRDSEDEKWWGFSEPKEIKKLAKWLAEHGGLKSISDDADQGEKKADHAEHTRVPPLVSPNSGYDLNLRELSPLSSLSDEEDDVDRKKFGEADTMLLRPPTKHGLNALIKDLDDFAEFLAWRIENLNTSKKK